MKMSKGFTVLELLIVVCIAALSLFLFVGSWIASEHKANVWNRCHPQVPITATEAWWITDLQLDECEVPDETL